MKRDVKQDIKSARNSNTHFAKTQIKYKPSYLIIQDKYAHLFCLQIYNIQCQSLENFKDIQF